MILASFIHKKMKIILSFLSIYFTTVDRVIADITNYEAPDLYNIVVIDRALHKLQNDEIRNVVLEKSSNAISKVGFILISDTHRHKSLICDYFKSVPKI